jgi:hypothetical protein
MARETLEGQGYRILRPEMKVLYMSAFALITGQQEFSEARSG